MELTEQEKMETVGVWREIYEKKSFTFDGYSVGSDKPASFTVGADKISLEDKISLATLALIPGYRVPACLDDTQLWQELRNLCFRVIYEMTETTIASESVDNPDFVPLAYDKACYSMLKLRDVIDEVRSRGCIPYEVEAPWRIAENDNEDFQ